MANTKHLALIKQGVAVWNAWRAAHLKARPDLLGASLFGANLCGANLREADLRGADLSYADLSYANLARGGPAGGHLGRGRPDPGSSRLRQSARDRLERAGPDPKRADRYGSRGQERASV